MSVRAILALLLLLTVGLTAAHAPLAPKLKDLGWLKGEFEGIVKSGDPAEADSSEPKLRLVGSSTFGDKFLQIDYVPLYGEPEDAMRFELVDDTKNGKLRAWFYDATGDDGAEIYEMDEGDFTADEDQFWWKDSDDGRSKFERTSKGLKFTYTNKKGDIEMQADLEPKEK